jgi:hypothetical protein
LTLKPMPKTKMLLADLSMSSALLPSYVI